MFLSGVFPTTKIILLQLQVFCPDVGSAVLKGLKGFINRAKVPNHDYAIVQVVYGDA